MNTDHSLHSACLYRLHQQRLRQAGNRTREAAEDTEARLQNQRLRQARLHARETPEHTAARLQDQRLRQADLRAGEDAVQTEARLQEQRIRQANLRERETAAACAARMDTDCSRHRDMFQRRLREALQAKNKLGCFTDTLDFIETAYAETAIKHELPSLFTTNTCSHCHAHCWKEERPGFCCEKGRVHLDDLPEPPADIRRLYERSRSFLDNLRSYNNALAMASIRCDKAVIDGFNPTFKIQGKVYNRPASPVYDMPASYQLACTHCHDTHWRRLSVVVAPEQGSPPKVGFPASIVNTRNVYAIFDCAIQFLSRAKHPWGTNGIRMEGSFFLALLLWWKRFITSFLWKATVLL